MLKEMKSIIREQVENFPLIRRLARYEIKSAHAEQRLGLLWELLNPGLQIFIYWFVFGVGLRGMKMSMETFHSSYGFSVGSSFGSLSTMLYYVDRTRSIVDCDGDEDAFPMSAIPSYVILSRMYQHFAMLVIVFIVILAMGFRLHGNYFSCLIT